MIHTSVGGDLKTTNSVWNGPGAWPPATTGTGFTVAGTIVDIRNHHVQEGSNRKFHRYVALVVEKQAARKRQFKNGVELETNWNAEKLEKTGFLNIYDHKDAEDPAAVSSNELNELVKRYYSENDDELHPKKGNVFEFWGTSADMKSKELKKGDRVQLKTKGDSIFIDTCVTDSTKQPKSQSYAGEDVLNNWTHKLNDKPNANTRSSKPLPGEELDGAGDEGWDD